jgi:copper resistance protein C
MRFLRWCATILVSATATVLVAGAPAQAHNSLVEAVPAKDAKLTKVPAQVKLKFLQELDERYLTIAVTDAQKQKVTDEAPEADGQVGTLALPETLPDGKYTVAYRVVSKDGHTVQGSYTFSLDAPLSASSEPAPAPSASEAAPVPASPSASAPAAQLASDEGAASEGGGNGMVIALVVLGVVLVGAGVAVLLRRRKA